ncbi:legume-like lectin family-domain-containing protein [Polychytrium aggregatum]|uniref:legume-like lectin family-domain-containing protein n=1 Tax=Polychytrium aggregatum TaxID=110093 RepID=UPI0022FE6401|nr:legume-like lectin family-domain-containing protein [Polychytrium aggregatum]KAI9202588.1 legume-like lectin family-domain-containing protein [Polychytrium aggregatum]
MLSSILRTSLLALLLSSVAVATSYANNNQGNSGQSGEIPARHDYKQTFKKPYYLYNDNHTIPYWNTHGNALLGPSYIRLSPSVPSTLGAIWSSVPNPHKEWEVIISFRVSGRDYLGGDGFAFWYTQEHDEMGPVYGSRDYWHGIGIVFDTSDQKENRYIPLIYGIHNDGHKSLAHRDDYISQTFGACFRDYRNSPNDVNIKIVYSNKNLKVLVDLRQGGHGYTECLTYEGVDLPTGYHFGLSASSSAHGHDDHDIISFDTYELNPAGGNKNKGSSDFHLSDDIKKKINFIEHQTQELLEAEEEDDAPEGYQEVINPHVIQGIQENQFKIIESLNILEHTLNSVFENTGNSHEAGRSRGDKLDAIERKLGELEQKLEILTTAIAHMTSSGNSQIQNVKDKIDTAHEILQKTQQHTSYTTWLIIGFVVLFVGYAGYSVYRKNFEEKHKKYF